MRKIILTTLVMAFSISAISLAESAASGSEETAWFDMKNCGFCKHLTKNDKLMDNMTWEHHEISDGLLTITTVKPEFKAAYMEAQAGMMKLAKKLDSGELQMADVKLCNHCRHYGELVSLGAKVDYVQGEAAEVTLMTSDNPETQKKIKDFCKRNQVELAKWKEEQASQH